MLRLYTLYSANGPAWGSHQRVSAQPPGACVVFVVDSRPLRFRLTDTLRHDGTYIAEQTDDL
ncbi:hypothetical protein ACIO3O_40050 [Streptomyces sp. NPDC087440]|uniref:hypothetical protein n=1 Tax=Streptomyces sp. NPDC087440 TaxID=3365790 RepID=UPI00382ED325